MSSQTPTPTPSAAPQATPAAPAAPERPKSLDEALDRVTKPAQEAPKAAAPAETAATPPARRSVKVKLDKEEEEIDETWFADEAKAKRLKENFEKGYGSDRRVEREREEARKATAKTWADWLRSQGYEMAQDPTNPSGWKLVAKQVAKPAAATPDDSDPLAMEEKGLREKIKAAEVVDPDWLIRLSEIRAERAKQGAMKEWEAKQEAQAQKVREARESEDRTTQQKAMRERALSAVNAEIGKTIEARAKSFDGPDKERRLTRLRALAVAASEEAAADQSKDWDAVLAAAKQVVLDEADDLDARVKHYRESLSQQPQRPEATPIIGTTPAGGGSSGKPKNIDEALDRVFGAA